MNIEFIKQRKKELNLTNKDLAEMSGISFSVVCKITSGVIDNPMLSTLRALADVLHCTLDDFDDSPPNTTDTKKALLLNNFDSLNELGKEKVIDYSIDISDNPKYKKEV